MPLITANCHIAVLLRRWYKYRGRGGRERSTHVIEQPGLISAAESRPLTLVEQMHVFDYLKTSTELPAQIAFCLKPPARKKRSFFLQNWPTTSQRQQSFSTQTLSKKVEPTGEGGGASL